MPQPKKRKSSKPSSQIKSVRELGEAVGRSHVSIGKNWLRHAEWPFPRKGPWKRSDVPAMLRWAADTLRVQIEPGGTAEETPGGVDPDDAKELRKEKLRKEIRKLTAQADTAETALSKERGHLLDANEVEVEWVSVGLRVRNAFQNLGSQLVPLALSHGMPREAAAAFGQQVDEATNGILRHLSKDGDSDDEDDKRSAA